MLRMLANHEARIKRAEGRLMQAESRLDNFASTQPCPLCGGIGCRRYRGRLYCRRTRPSEQAINAGFMPVKIGLFGGGVFEPLTGAN